MGVKTDQPTTENADCPHPRATHYHGTYSCYVDDGCRCPRCRHANTRYVKMRRRERAGFRVHVPHQADWYLHSEAWRADLRRGLRSAVLESIERHGVVA